jgi:SAM-dependent methyltransferase
LRPVPNRRTALPGRYSEEWGTEFWGFVDDALRPGIAILDVGAGRRPTLAPERRPPGCRYVGLDISGAELETAPPGSYDETVVANVEVLVPRLADSTDLIVAWQALEHVRDLQAAGDAFHSYLRDGGRFVGCLSGRHAAFAVANRLLPTPLSSRLVAHLMSRPLETVFPAHYDSCDDRGLRRVFSGWDSVEVVPLWHGADYFTRLPRLLGPYLRYEDWAIRHRRANLATHYVVAAGKGRRDSL